MKKIIFFHHFQAVITERNEELLKDVGVTFEENARNLFIVEGLNGAGPRLLNKEDDLELGASASPEEPSSSNSYSPPLPPPMMMQEDVHNVSFKCPLSNKNVRQRQAKIGNSSLKSSPRSGDSFYPIGKNLFASKLHFPTVPNSIIYALSTFAGYRGLVNQAMTCYLNSLLQALFMTPEFRNALYNWKFVPSPDTDESKSIPYQLQRLFLNLQVR